MKNIFFFLFLWGFSVSLFAQAIIPEDYHKIFTPTLNVQANWTKGVKTEDGNFQTQYLNVQYNHLLFGQKRVSAYTVVPSFFRVMLNTSARVTMPRFSPFPTQHLMIQPAVGITGYYFRRMKNLFLLNASTFLGEDQYTIINPQLKWRANFLYRRQFSTAFWAGIGVGYSYLLGGGKLYPIVGVAGWATENLYYQVYFPFQAQISYYQSTWTRWSAVIRPNGNIHRFADKDNIPYLPEIALWRQREIKAGLQGAFNSSHRLRWIVETGGVFFRKTIFSNVQQKFQRHDELAAIPLKPSVYLQAGVQVSFGEKTKTQNRHFEFLEQW
ncbi:MAG: hypothetical protein ACKVTZ_09540 [Bacteroidia bacterium]